MWKPRRSNCNVWAWEQFRRGHTDRMTLRHTHYAKGEKVARSWLWRMTLTPLGYVLGYPAWVLVQVCWFLMFGRWAHVTTDKWEFVPTGNNAERKYWIPPLIFKGKVQEIGRPE